MTGRDEVAATNNDQLFDIRNKDMVTNSRVSSHISVATPLHMISPLWNYRMASCYVNELMYYNDDDSHHYVVCVVLASCRPSFFVPFIVFSFCRKFVSSACRPFPFDSESTSPTIPWCLSWLLHSISWPSALVHLFEPLCDLVPCLVVDRQAANLHSLLCSRSHIIGLAVFCRVRMPCDDTASTNKVDICNFRHVIR